MGKNQEKTSFLPPFKTKESSMNWKGCILTGDKKVNYVIVKLIKAQSSSSVWLAYEIDKCKKEKSLNNFYAIKIHFTTDVEEGLKELQIANMMNSQIHVRNILLPIDTFIITRKIDNKEKKNICIVMKLMACTVHHLLSFKEFENGLPLNIVKSIIFSTLQTLEDLHKNNVIHGDVKAENILLEGIHKDNEIDIKNILSKTSKTAVLKYISKNNNSSHSDSDSDSANDENSDNDSDNDNDENSDSDSGYYETEDNNSVDSRIYLYSDDDDGDGDGDDDDGDDDDEVKNDIDIDIDVDKKYIENPKTYLSDWGFCIVNNDYRKKYLQTKECRSPEILLRLGYNEKSDLWALGCTAYELATGYPLIYYDCSENEQHLFQMKLITEIAGKIPNDMINNSPHKELYFTQDNHIKGVKLINTNKLSELEEILEKRGEYKKDIALFIDMMLELLEVDPRNRVSSKKSMEHPFFM